MTIIQSLLGEHREWLAADSPDGALVAHYGDPLAEQRALAEDAGLVDRSNRELLVVSGPDRLSWLHSLTSQHLTELAPWTATEALVLSPHGHVEHHLLVHDDGERTWLEVEPGTRDDLLAWLASMRFLLRVELAPVTGAVFTLAGPRAADVLAATGLPAPPAGRVAAAGPVTLRGRRWPAGSADLIVTAAHPSGVTTPLVAAGARPAGLWAYEALRVVAREPRLRFESDHRTIPHEVGWLSPAVHLDKGCYRGQETVARVHNLGRPPRRLVLLQLDGSGGTLPGHAADVLWSGSRVGFVTTSARHYEQGPVALALIKRNTPDDAPLTAGNTTARIDIA